MTAPHNFGDNPTCNQCGVIFSRVTKSYLCLLTSLCGPSRRQTANLSRKCFSLPGVVHQCNGCRWKAVTVPYLLVVWLCSPRVVDKPTASTPKTCALPGSRLFVHPSFFVLNGKLFAFKIKRAPSPPPKNKT